MTDNSLAEFKSIKQEHWLLINGIGKRGPYLWSEFSVSKIRDLVNQGFVTVGAGQKIPSRSTVVYRLTLSDAGWRAFHALQSKWTDNSDIRDFMKLFRT